MGINNGQKKSVLPLQGSVLFFFLIMTLIWSACSKNDLSYIEEYIEIVLQNDLSLQSEYLTNTKDSVRLNHLLAIHCPTHWQKHDKLNPTVHALSALKEQLNVSFDTSGMHSIWDNLSAWRKKDVLYEILYNSLVVLSRKQLTPSVTIAEEISQKYNLAFHYLEEAKLLKTYFEYSVDHTKTNQLNEEKYANVINHLHNYAQAQLLENKALSNHFKKASLNQFCIELIKEFDINDLTNNIQYYINNLSLSSTKDSISADVVKSYILDFKGESDEAIALMESCLEKEMDVNNRYRVLINLGVFYLNKNSDKAFEFFEKAHKLFEDWDCHHRNIISLVYLIHTAPNKAAFNTYKKQIEALRDCPGKTGKYASFISLDFLRDHPFSEYSAEVQIEINFKRKELAKEIWVGKASFHIQDLHAKIASEIISTYHSHKHLIDHNAAKQIIKLVQETKIQELKRKRHEDASRQLSPNQTQTLNRISEIFKTTQDLLDTSYYGDPIFIELYELLKEKGTWPQFHEMVNKSEPTKNLSSYFMSGDHQVIEYFTYKSDTWFYYYTRDTLQLGAFSTATLDSLVQAFNHQIMQQQDLQNTSENIKQLILPSQLHSEGDLLILADGNTFQLSFELLLPEQSIHYHFDLYEYQSMDTLTIQNPSVSLLSYTNLKTQNDTRIKAYPELPKGWEETQSIRQVFNSVNTQTLAGEQMTKQNLKSSMLVDISHISSHASMNKENRLDNYILLRDAEGNAEKWYSYEIENLEESPSVITLSACETGTGAHRNGAGTYSISRAFLHAGSASIIKSLWKVNEQATAIFMPSLYRHWSQGHSLDKALKLAKEEVKNIDRFAHPYYWAGFILEGNPHVYLQKKHKQ